MLLTILQSYICLSGSASVSIQLSLVMLEMQHASCRIMVSLSMDETLRNELNGLEAFRDHCFASCAKHHN